MTERQPLDDIDLKILSELQRDGRIRNNELAERVGLSEPPCRRRVRALASAAMSAPSEPRSTKRCWLRGHFLCPDPVAEPGPGPAAGVRKIDRGGAAGPAVLADSGDADYLLKCVARNVEGMHQQLLQFSAMPEVRNIRTFPVLGVAKDAPLPIPGDPASGLGR
jgi:hypothetical protein